MATARLDPRRFGRRPISRCDTLPVPTGRLDDDLRLFSVTFAAGFLFVSILIG